VAARSQKSRIWLAVGGVVGYVLLLTAVVLWLVMDVFGACRDVVLTSVRSPDGKKSVVISRRECGATVADSSHASIVPAGEFFSVGKHPPFLSLAGTSDIVASWRGNNVVEIALIPGGIREVKREPRVGDVQIDYK
jgi:hypothetical protein